ncbi:MAG: TIGR01620 family protein [Pseudomonadota bacterium]
MTADPTPRRGAILFDDAPEQAPDPAAAPPVPDEVPVPPVRGRAMQTVAVLAAPRGRSLAGWFLGTFGALVAFAASLALYDFVAGLIATRPLLGWIALGLTGAFLAACLAVALREVVALSRLARIDDLRQAAAAAVDLAGARALVDRLVAFYAGRPDTRWGREELAARRGDVFDAPDLVALAERQLLGPLDAAASREVEAAARQVALVTAVVPLALADVAAALTANLRMIRRIALIYGGRGGTLGSWRLARTVLTHLAATGAVAVGDDLIHSVAGGGVLAKVSRRFGEGIVNGALTARVGLAAMEVCRPLPFVHERPPRTTAVIQRALTGLFGPKE